MAATTVPQEVFIADVHINAHRAGIIQNPTLKRAKRILHKSHYTQNNPSLMLLN
jgi:hypothetical protein